VSSVQVTHLAAVHRAGDGGRDDEIMNEPMFEVSCDPPYEDMDGGPGACITEVSATDLRDYLASLADMTSRLDPGQVPMIIEVRRLDTMPRWDETECKALGHTREDHIDPDEVMLTRIRKAGSTGERPQVSPEQLDRLGEKARADVLRYVPVKDGGYGY
jgi:hypothetical protein